MFICYLFGSYAKGVSYKDLIRDEMLIDAIMFWFIQMVENISRLSIEYRTNHPEIHWGQIIGLEME